MLPNICRTEIANWLRLELKTIRLDVLLASPHVVGFGPRITPFECALEYAPMSDQDSIARIAELKQRLEELEEQFRVEARKRGFDPAQAENMALPASLSRLFAECAEIKSELEELAIADQTGEGSR